MNPPLRETADRDAMLKGIADGSVDVIATDHAPHHYDEKHVEFDHAPFGITGLETAVSLCFDRLVHAGVIARRTADRAAVGQPGPRAPRAGRRAVGGRPGRHLDPRPRSRRHRVSRAHALEVEEHAVRRLEAPRRRRRDDRRRADDLRES